MWGSAADQDQIYVANSDVRFADGYLALDPNAGGGLFALELATGKISMQVPPVPCGDRKRCSPALGAAVTAIPGVVFSGGMSGHLRAYATDDARLLWEVDTARDYPIVNGGSAFAEVPWRTRPDDRGWHALREFRLRSMGRSARQRPVSLRSRNP